MRRFRGVNIGIILALAVLAVLAMVPLGERSPVSADATIVSSTFDTGNEGWKKISLADNGPFDVIYADFGPANYESSGGNPGGHIATDDLDGQTMWFDAPTKFLGDKSAAYGGALSYDLKLSGTAGWTTADVALVGPNMVLVYRNATDPGSNWTHFNISLNETAGWKKNGLSGATPTQAEFKAVLAKLTALRIRGEFIYGSEYNRLDNVTMPGGLTGATSTPTPVIGGIAASSTFDTDNEGWKKISLADHGPFDVIVTDGGLANYESTSGNPGGCIATTDIDGQTDFFEAPAKFLGDKSGSYGGTLSYDIKLSGSADWTTADVVLVGGGMVLVYQNASNPGTAWTHFTVPLTETAGWKKTSLEGSTPTQAEFRAVLGRLTALRIRGEYIYGSEYNRLDNVILTGTAGGGVPTPTAAPAPTTPTVAPPPPPPGGGTQVSYKAGWNIVAGPGGSTFSQANRMLYTSQGSGGYDVLINSQGVTEGWGYWAYFASDTTVTISGAGSNSYTTALDAGQMKMVGNPSGTKSAKVTADKIYTYDPVNGYSMTFGSATLPVGAGAWVYSGSGGTVTITTQ